MFYILNSVTLWNYIVIDIGVRYSITLFFTFYFLKNQELIPLPRSIFYIRYNTYKIFRHQERIKHLKYIKLCVRFLCPKKPMLR